MAKSSFFISSSSSASVSAASKKYSLPVAEALVAVAPAAEAPAAAEAAVEAPALEAPVASKALAILEGSSDALGQHMSHLAATKAIEFEKLAQSLSETSQRLRRMLTLSQAQGAQRQ